MKNISRIGVALLLDCAALIHFCTNIGNSSEMLLSLTALAKEHQ